MWILSGVGVTGKSNMAAINRKDMNNYAYLNWYAIHDSNEIPTVYGSSFQDSATEQAV